MNIPAKVRNGIFAILLSSCIVSSMVHTVLNTALFPIMEEFDISAARAQWLITAFSLVMGVMVLATASLIRRFPNRPLYLTFMGLFCLGLLLSAAAPSFSVLLIGRILQALGCGMLLSLTQVVVLSAYPSEAQGRVMGIYGLAVSAAPVLAPTLSGRGPKRTRAFHHAGVSMQTTERIQHPSRKNNIRKSWNAKVVFCFA